MALSVASLAISSNLQIEHERSFCPVSREIHTMTFPTKLAYLCMHLSWEDHLEGTHDLCKALGGEGGSSRRCLCCTVHCEWMGGGLSWCQLAEANWLRLYDGVEAASGFFKAIRVEVG